jgi:hypothetical protein
MRKNGEGFVVDFACVKCHRIGILHDLTDIRRKASASFGLRMERVPVAYQQHNTAHIFNQQKGMGRGR